MRHPCARFWVQVHALIAISAIETHLRFWTQISGIRFIGLANIPHSDFSYASIISNYPGMLLVKAGSQFHLNFYSKLNHSIYLCFFLFNFNLIFFFFISVSPIPSIFFNTVSTLLISCTLLFHSLFI